MNDLGGEYRGWPLNQSMILENRKVIYLPIAKNACSSLKTLMVEMSGLPNREQLKKDVHRKLDRNSTGLQFKDHPEARLREALADPSFFRFSVVREPLDRMLSVYIEKFVTNRNRPYQWSAIGPVVGAVQGVGEPAAEEMDRGITFAQFVDYILGQPLHTLDPHWRPQFLNFERVPYPNLYTMGSLDLLAEDLQRHTGMPVSLPMHNVSREGGKRRVEGAADMLPGDLPEPGRIDVESFFDADRRGRVERAYAQDFTLYRAAERAMELRRAAAAQSRAGAEAEAEAPEPGAGLPPPVIEAPLPTHPPMTLRKALSLNAIRRLAGLPPVPRRTSR